MESKIKKYNAVIRIRSDKTGIIKERGFVSIAEANDEWHFLADMVDDLEIFFRLDWYAGMDMPEFNGEYWFGKRNKRETG